MTNPNNNRGFSLIELMIVVGIISILSAIAIPNFQRFQMKSRQSEAKNAMAAVYQAEKAFHQEWGQYFGDWRDIGYAPEGVMKYYIRTTNAAGSNSPGATSGYMGPAGQAAAPTYTNSTNYCVGPGGVVQNFSVCSIDGDFQVAAAQAAATAQTVTLSNFAFQAAAGTDLDRGRDATYDVWTIDHNKSLVNLINDAAD